MISALEDDTDCHSAVAVVISAHGDENGLQVKYRDNNVFIKNIFDTKKIFDTLEMNRDLIGKPKIVILDACRAGKRPEYQHGMTVSEGLALQDPCTWTVFLVVDKCACSLESLSARMSKQTPRNSDRAREAITQ